MEKVKIGTKVVSLGINRVTVADNCKCRAILLDPDPCVKYVAWDENIKRRVEVDQDMVIRYGLRPSTNYYYLVARLNTDMQGNIVSPSYVVEYLQLSENLNNEFSDALQEFGEFSSLALTKVKKSDGQRDLSYIKVTPSREKAFPETLEKIEEIRNTPSAIEGMWQLVDAATSINKETYIKLKENPEEGTRPQLSAPSRPSNALPQNTATRQYRQPQQAHPEAPAPEGFFADDFDSQPFEEKDF